MRYLCILNLHYFKGNALGRLCANSPAQSGCREEPVKPEGNYPPEYIQGLKEARSVFAGFTDFYNKPIDSASLSAFVMVCIKAGILIVR